MGKILTTIFGAGFVGSLYALRTYLGIALILMVSTCSFKSDIVDYVKESRKESHQERLAQINYETEKLKIEMAEKAKLEQIQKEKQAQLEQEQKRKEQEQLKKEQIRKQQEQAKLRDQEELEKKYQQEKERLENLKRMAKLSVCTNYYNQYKSQLLCAATPNHHTCATGYTPAQWSMGAGQVRRNAINEGCDVQY